MTHRHSAEVAKKVAGSKRVPRRGREGGSYYVAQASPKFMIFFSLCLLNAETKCICHHI